MHLQTCLPTQPAESERNPSLAGPSLFEYFFLFAALLLFDLLDFGDGCVARDLPGLHAHPHRECSLVKGASCVIATCPFDGAAELGTAQTGCPGARASDVRRAQKRARTRWPCTRYSILDHGLRVLQHLREIVAQSCQKVLHAPGHDGTLQNGAACARARGAGAPTAPPRERQPWKRWTQRSRATGGPWEPPKKTTRAADAHGALQPNAKAAKQQPNGRRQWAMSPLYRRGPAACGAARPDLLAAIMILLARARSESPTPPAPAAHPATQQASGQSNARGGTDAPTVQAHTAPARLPP